MAKKTTFTATASTSRSTTSSPHSATGVTIDDFVAYLPKHVYIFTVCREIWLGAGVNACLPPVQVFTQSGKPKRDMNGNFVYQSATKWLDKHRGIEQATWCPGQPMLIKDRVVVDGGWIERKGVTTFNWYRPPRIELGDAAKAEPWIKHVHKVLHADDAKHCIKWFAHRVQRPAEKINHGLVIGGQQGIGKDSMLEPLKHAVGPWNFHDVSPKHLFGDFNSFAKSVILRVNEGRDLGEIDRFKFYDHTKDYTAATGRSCGTGTKPRTVTLTSRLISTLDISDFNPKAPPPKTQAWWDIVSVNQAPEDAELADVIDAMKGPP